MNIKQRMITAAVAAGATFTLMAGPAGAHVNDRIPENRGAAQAQTRQGGAPFAGFVGPVEGFVGSEIYVRAHSGMECGALRNPNMTALGPAGINADPRFVCPSTGKGNGKNR
jgi:hypothetical protein